MKTTKTDYLIMELNAKNMTNNLKPFSAVFHFDFLLPENRKKYINIIDRYDANPLFDQIDFLYQTDAFKDQVPSRFVTKLPHKFSDTYVDLSDAHKIEKAIVFVDCSGVINERIFETNGHSLFTSGFMIQYGEQAEDFVHYIPFDKSNSMSKKNKISFIDKRLYEAMNKRLLFDLDFRSSKYPLLLSKFFAYKGLYMSSSVRVDRELLSLNADNFIVILDKNWNVKCPDQAFYGNHPTIAPIRTEDHFDLYSRYSQDLYNIDNLFDGEGLISPDFAKLLNKSISKEGSEEDPATSFQIRMPFVKGMLHQVDFRDFLKSYVQNIKSTEPIYILDYFGQKRDLRKAQIIIPSSMFKWGPWLKQLLSSDSDASMDPMEFYFEKFDAYKHSMYVANTNTILGNKQYTTLNYQFINTLKLDPDSLKSLLDSHLEKAMDPYSYIKDMSATDIDENGEPVYKELSSSMSALMKNPVFVHQKKIDADLRATSNSLIVDAALGKLIVDGEIRFLSRDLLFFLTDLLYRIAEYLESELAEDSISKPGQKPSFSDEYRARCQSQIETLRATANTIYKKSALRSWTFYMPGSKTELDQRRYYSIFRSPHLSRNEQCALMPYSNKLYEKYFSHLSGVIMLSVSSLDPLALGGADFDGDFVKVISNPMVTRAVLEGAYEKKTKEDRTYYVRSLPILDIKSQSGAKYIVPDTTSALYLQTILNTFDSKVGNISNAAIRLGQIQYAYGNDKVTSDLSMKCQDCTILTGLEIDAAKTGYHPEYLNSLLAYSTSSGDSVTLIIDDEPQTLNGLHLSYDYIEEFKKKLDLLKSDRTFHFSKTPDEMLASKQYTVKRWNNNYITYDGNEHPNNLSYLPMYFFEHIGRYKAPESDDTSGYIYFPFMGKEAKDSTGASITKYDRTWKKSIDEELHKKVASTVCAYQEILSLITRVNRYADYCKRNNVMAHIRFILNLQYDDENTIDYIAESTLPQAYALIEQRISDQATDDVGFHSIIDGLIASLRKDNWAFLLEKQKDAFLRKLFHGGANDSADIGDDDAAFYHALGIPVSSDDDTVLTGHTLASIVKNFHMQGYNLLYLILQDIKMSRAEFDVPSDIIDYINSSMTKKYKDVSEDDLFIRSDFYKEYYKHLYELYTNRDFLTQKELRNLLLADCKHKINECFKEYYKRTKNAPAADDKVKVLYGLNRSSYKVDANNRFFWDYFSPAEIIPLISQKNVEGEQTDV